MSLTIPAISQEWISTLVVAEDDPTGLPARFAFPTTGTDPSSWHDGEWVTPARLQPDGRFQTRARIKIGPDTAVDLGEGTYDCWFRAVESDPNGPTRPFDLLTIT